MDIPVKTPDILKRKAMKKRLNMWDSFFSKVQDEFVNSKRDGSCSDPEINKSCLQDPQLLSINEQHNDLRRSLRIEHGINEESEISESEAEWQACENSELATDNDNLSEEALEESEDIDYSDQATDNGSSSGEVIREEKLSKKNPKSDKKTVKIWKTPNVRPKSQVIKTDNSKKSADNNSGSPTKKKSKIELRKPEISNLNGVASIRKDTIRRNLEGEPVTEDYHDLKIRKGKVVAELTTSCEIEGKRPPKALASSTPIDKRKEKRLLEVKEIRVPDKSSNNKEPPNGQMGPPKAPKDPETSRTGNELHRFKNNNTNIQAVDGHSGSNVQRSSSNSPQDLLSDPAMTTYQIHRKQKIKEMCKQYDIWKLHERRKSGRLGSVHIVSDLNEEPSEANRIDPVLPPVVKNPFQVPRRFSLQKTRYYSF